MLYRYLGYITNLTEHKRFSDAGCFAPPPPQTFNRKYIRIKPGNKKWKVLELKFTGSKQCKMILYVTHVTS